VFKGLDIYGLCLLVVGGIVIVKVVEKVIEKVKVMVLYLLEVSLDDLEFGEGKFIVRGID